MRCLPGINSGGKRWRLPLSAPTAELLAQWRLETNHASLANQLRSQLRQDPAFTLWLLCKASESAAEPRTLAELAAWFTCNMAKASTASLLLTWNDADIAHVKRMDSVTSSWRDEAHRLTTAGMYLAASAHHQAVQSSHSHPDEVLLVALLYHYGEWFALSGCDSSDSGEPPVPAWLRLEIAALTSSSEVSPAGITACVKAALAQPPQAASIGTAQEVNVWEDAHSPWPRLLPQLSQRLTRQEDLEHRFEERLEIEKLEAMAELAAGAGHEINNPLAVISGRAQLMMRDEHDPTRKRGLASIHAQALRVHEMISDLMLFGRPPQLELQKIDLVELLDELTSNLVAIAEPRRIEISTVVRASELWFEADPVQLTVALRAVTDNALEAIGEGGQIHIEVSTIEPHAAADAQPVRQIEVAIRDDGPGIPPEVRRHLFDPFFSGRSAGRGLGFGLTKCWRIVTAHGGQVDVSSEVGVGTEFRIVLPLAETAQPQPVISGERS